LHNWKLFIYWWRRRISFVTVCFEWSLLLFIPLTPNTFSAFLTIAHWNASVCLLSPSACLYCYILFLHPPIPNYSNKNFCLLYIPLSFFFYPFAISEQTFYLCLNVPRCSNSRDGLSICVCVWTSLSDTFFFCLECLLLNSSEN